MPNRYKVGQVARCTGKFRDEDNVLQDPGAVFFHLIDPSNNPTTLQYGVDAALIKESTGSYYVDVDADEEGIFQYRFWSTGVYKTADEDQFEVVPSEHV